MSPAPKTRLRSGPLLHASARRGTPGRAAAIVCMAMAGEGAAPGNQDQPGSAVPDLKFSGPVRAISHATMLTRVGTP